MDVSNRSLGYRENFNMGGSVEIWTTKRVRIHPSDPRHKKFMVDIFFDTVRLIRRWSTHRMTITRCTTVTTSNEDVSRCLKTDESYSQQGPGLGRTRCRDKDWGLTTQVFSKVISMTPDFCREDVYGKSLVGFSRHTGRWKGCQKQTSAE